MMRGNSKMKNIMNVSLAMMAISTTSCAGLVKSEVKEHEGRIIEFKSDSNGFDTKSFFYEGEKEVIAFDSQFTPEIAKQSIAYLRKYTKKPISWLVITHPNPDKFNGASVFKQEGAKILASENTAKAIPDVHAYKEYYFVEMAKMFPKGQYPQPTLIDQTFIGKMDLVLQGGERIQFQELSHSGVSSTQTVAYIKTAQTLIVGDLIHNQAHAWLEGGIVKGKPTPNIEEWILDLQELESLYPKSTKVLGGRGVSLELKESVKEQTKYLRIARELVRQQLNEMDPKDSQFYKVLAQKFQKQFSNYTLPYMIEYGAYGLVQSELSVK